MVFTFHRNVSCNYNFIVSVPCVRQPADAVQPQDLYFTNEVFRWNTGNGWF
jgi:hypothetical protein